MMYLRLSNVLHPTRVLNFFARPGSLQLDAPTTLTSRERGPVGTVSNHVPNSRTSSVFPLSILPIKITASSQVPTVGTSPTTATSASKEPSGSSGPRISSKTTSINPNSSFTSTFLSGSTHGSTQSRPRSSSQRPGSSSQSQSKGLTAALVASTTRKTSAATSTNEGVTTAFSAPTTISSVSNTTSSTPKDSAQTNQSLNSKQPIGATVGGVLGGVLGLVIIAATLFVCRRKRQNRYDLDLLRASRDKNTVSPSPSEKKEWSTRIDTAMEDAARQTERTLSRAGSTPRTSSYSDTSGRHSPDTLGDKYRYGSPGRAISPETPPPVLGIYHRELFRRHSYSETREDAETEEDTLIQDFGSSLGSTSSRSLTNKEELERERRLEEIFKQMRSVLDNSP